MSAEVYSLFFKDNKKDKYKTESYRIDKNKLNGLKMFFDNNIIDKINTSMTYTYKDIHKLFEDNIIDSFDNIFDYLKYRDIFNKNKPYIEMLKNILDNCNLSDDYDLSSYVSNNSYTMPILQIKKLFKNNISEDSDDDSKLNEEEQYNVFCEIFSQLGIISRDPKTCIINPSFYKLFKVESKNTPEDYKTNHDIKTIKDINFNEFFPGKSNGRIIRYLKIYKVIPNKGNTYTKEKFKEELLALPYVEVKKNEIYYKKDMLDGLKEWIADKILK